MEFISYGIPGFRYRGKGLAWRRFAADPKDPLLRTHKLKGELEGYWAFSVDADLRVMFRWVGDEAFLVNLGNHDQIY